MVKTRRPQGVDYKNLIYAKVFENPGITKDSVVLKLRGARNTIYNNIREMIVDGVLVYKKRGLYINPDHVPNISKKLENLQNYLKGYHQTVSNVLPRIEEIDFPSIFPLKSHNAISKAAKAHGGVFNSLPF